MQVAERSESKSTTAGLAGLDPAWAWSPYVPEGAGDRSWDLRWAGHLWRRAGFGGTRRQLEESVKCGPEEAVRRLLAGAEGRAEFEERFAGFERAAARSGDGRDFSAWWLRRLVEGPDPLRERLTLIWHGHFAIRAEDTGDLELYRRHVAGLRDDALGEAGKLVRGQMEDPALDAALAGGQQWKGRPNRGYARRWLTQFTVGPAEAREGDIEGAARALTGWFVRRGELVFVAREHDNEVKRVLGSEGPLGRPELARILGEHPATHRTLVRRLFRGLVSESVEPPEALLAPLAQALGRGRPLAEIVATLLRSNLFYSEHAYRQRVKSPVELAVGLVRSVEGAASTAWWVDALGAMGQRLDQPPSARGWPEGTDWIHTASLSRRWELGRRLLDREGGARGEEEAWSVAQRAGCSNLRTAARWWAEVLWQPTWTEGEFGEAWSRVTGGDGSASGLGRWVVWLMRQPEFQLA